MSNNQCSVFASMFAIKTSNKPVRLIVFHTGKKFPPFANGSFRQFTPEFLVDWKSPLDQRTRRKTLEARRKTTTNSTHIKYWAGIEPRPHWREASNGTCWIPSEHGVAASAKSSGEAARRESEPALTSANCYFHPRNRRKE